MKTDTQEITIRPEDIRGTCKNLADGARIVKTGGHVRFVVVSRHPTSAHALIRAQCKGHMKSVTIIDRES